VKTQSEIKRRLSLREFRQSSNVRPVGVPGERTISALQPIFDHVVGLDALLPPFPTRAHLTDVEWTELVLTVQQAAIVALDTAVSAGEHGSTLTKNRVFDAIAARWSPTFQHANATRTWDMKPESVITAWREIIERGIRFENLWHVVKRGGPLYRTERVGRRGYMVLLEPDAAEGWVAILERDSEYRRQPRCARLRLVDDPLPSRTSTILKYETAGEWRYNVVEIGEDSDKILRQLEAVRVTFDHVEFQKHLRRCRRVKQQVARRLLAEFRLDIDRATLRPRGRNAKGQLRFTLAFEAAPPHGRGAPRPTDEAAVNEALRLKRRWLRAHADEITGIGILRDLDQLDTGTSEDNPINEPIEIRSQCMKTRNKRYQAMNFWPTEVTGKDHKSERDIDYSEPEVETPILRTTSRRGRWFSFDGQPLVGRDIASSQYQIIALVTGDRALEARAPRMKREFAEETWVRAKRGAIVLPDAYRSPADTRLLAAGKVVLLQHGYNGTVGGIHRQLRSDPETYGPGFGEQADLRALINGSSLLQTINTFKAACREVANAAIRRNPYAGVVIRDPYDGSQIRWNPIRRGRPVNRAVRCWKCVKADQADVTAPHCRAHVADTAWVACSHDVHGTRAVCRQCSACGRCWKFIRTWEPVTVTDTKLSVMPPFGEPYPNGDYPVNEAKLRNVVQPCLVHALDAMYCSLVIEELARGGITDVIAIHDAWLVAHNDESGLVAALDRASRSWLLKLGTVYDDIAAYLAGTAFEPWWAGCRARWEERVERKDWPTFTSSRPVIYDEKVITSRKEETDGQVLAEGGP
jgi:hypothetical protein